MSLVGAPTHIPVLTGDTHVVSASWSRWFLDLAKAVNTSASASGYVPYVGATTTLDLGTHSVYAANLTGTNTGDQTITLTGGVTGSGTGSFAATVITNANLTGQVTSVGNTTTVINSAVIAKVLTGYVSGAGTVAATDSILQAIQKLDGNHATNANLTGPITSIGNATSVASQTGTGSKFVMDTSPTLITPLLGTPTSGILTNCTGTASGLTSGNVTTNANLTGPITSVGNATSIASQTGTGTKFVMDTSPTLVTPLLGTPTSGVLTNCTGTASGLTSGNVTTNANLTGPITSVGNATSIASQTGTGTKFVVDTSPALAGTPTTTTAAVDTNTTQISSTAFVLAQSSGTNPIMDGAVAIGTSTRYARADHVHASDTTRALLAGSSSQAFSTANLSASSIASDSVRTLTTTTNGDMRISQMYEGASITDDGNANYVVDRWFIFSGVPGKFSAQRVVDAPVGLVYSTKLTVVAQYSPGASELFQFTHRIPGNRIAKFNFGTASAATITAYGWIKASVAGNYSCALRNAAGNRIYPFTIAATTSWAQWSITLTADTTGTWLSDNSNALVIIFAIGAGSSISTTANSWQAVNKPGVTDNLQFVNQVNGSTLNITGVDIVAGSVAPTYFSVQDYETTLDECQRYIEKSFPQGTAPVQNSGTTGAYAYSVNLVGALTERSPSFPFRVLKNATPTMTYYNPSASNAQVRDVTAAADCSATATDLSGDSNFSIVTTGNVGSAVGNRLAFHWLATAQL